MKTTVAVKGLADLGRAMKRMEATARKEVREKLKSVGQIVATEAQSIARTKGLVASGELVRKITPRVMTRAVVVRASAVRKSRKYPSGFGYPRRYEYEKSGARAFMRPALQAKQEEVIARFTEIFDELEREWMHG